MLKLKFVKATHTLFRLAIAGIFAYFGTMALINPILQAQLWVRPEFLDIINRFVDTELFMRLLGGLQVALAIVLISGKFLRIAFVVAAGLLVGIIINVGLNEVTYRDAVILAGVLYLLSQEL